VDAGSIPAASIIYPNHAGWGQYIDGNHCASGSLRSARRSATILSASAKSARSSGR